MDATHVNLAQVCIGLIIAIAFLLFAVLRTKIHPFIALIITALIAGVIGGMPVDKVPKSITTGFGNTIGSIGIIIGFGVIMGQIFERSKAAKTMARTFIRLFGKGHEELALAITGFLVSIPIFCDSGFVVLAPLAKSISKSSKKSITGLSVALASGLVITHSLIPPTPGPLGAAAQFKANIGELMLWGIVIAIPMAISGLLYAKYIGKKIYQIPSDDGESWIRPEKPLNGTEEFSLFEDEVLPSPFISFAPIVIPIVLILLSTVTSALKIKSPVIQLLGAPVVAVGIGVIFAIYTLLRGIDRKESILVMEKGIKSAGVIILVTGGGGALGQVIRDSGAGNAIATALSHTNLPIILLPFIIASIVRLIQGSGTVAMITAASITAPILLPLNINPVFATLSASIGSLVFSHFNDSFFWVVNRFSGIDEAKEQIRVWSVTTTICWATGIVSLLIVSSIFK